MPWRPTIYLPMLSTIEEMELVKDRQTASLKSSLPDLEVLLEYYDGLQNDDSDFDGRLSKTCANKRIFQHQPLVELHLSFVRPEMSKRDLILILLRLSRPPHKELYEVGFVYHIRYARMCFPVTWSPLFMASENVGDVRMSKLVHYYQTA